MELAGRRRERDLGVAGLRRLAHELDGRGHARRHARQERLAHRGELADVLAAEQLGDLDDDLLLGLAALRQERPGEDVELVALLEVRHLHLA